MWILRMAWRDSRGSRKGMMLFVTAMVVGIAALVAIESFRLNLLDAISEQARSIAGADLSISRNEPFDERIEALSDSVGGKTVDEIQFASMALFSRAGEPTQGEASQTRLVRVRALRGAFPLYGTLDTKPLNASEALRDSAGALVQDVLLLQFGAGPGDSVRIGDQSYRIAGSVREVPGETTVNAFAGPSVFIPLATLDRSLLETGSRASYTRSFRFDDDEAAARSAEAFESLKTSHRLSVSTLRESQEGWTEALDDLHGFLALIGFIALVLGGIGVASSVHVFAQRKIERVATLRCIGAKSGAATSIHLVQVSVLGLVAGVVGSLLGLLVQAFLPVVLRDVIPVDVDFSIRWSTVALGAGTGIAVSLAFALLPLLALRHISPLHALRLSYVSPPSWWRDPLRWGVVLAITAGIVGYATRASDEPLVGLSYALGLAAALGILAGLAFMLRSGMRKLIVTGWPFSLRQGLANLYRPNNQTIVITMAVGLATYLVGTLLLTRTSLLSEVQGLDADDGPNTILFDIQSDQIDAVASHVEDLGFPVFERTPIITMRLASVKGQSVEAMRIDSTFEGERWAWFREYRSTYRDVLTEAETIVDGEWHGGLEPGNQDTATVSVEADVADLLGVVPGDYIEFDVQGVVLPARVGSIREVDWRRVTSNFFMVFATGYLEAAPAFYVMTSRAATPDERARLQRSVVTSFPNVSIIDLQLIIETASQILSRIGFIVRFLALFSVITALLVLITALAVARGQQAREGILLRAIGASSTTVVRIGVAEYALLGLLSALAGLILACAAAWALSHFVFEMPFRISVWELFLLVAAVVALTVLVGAVTGSRSYTKPPLAVLRQESMN
jgi:putative ABC transport system permease protein